jgi:hypothetical protein
MGVWGLPFLERVTEWRECAADGKRLPLWRQRSPMYEGRGPGKRMPPGPPQGTSVLHTLGKYFPECYKRCLGVGSLLLLRRRHILLRAGVSSVHTWRTSAPRLVSSVLSTPLCAIRSDASIPPSEGQGRGFDPSGTGSPHHSPHWS